MFALAGPTFYMDDLVQKVVDVGNAFFEKDVSKLAMSVFFFCFFFHLVEGAAEMVDNPKTCRLTKSKFWMRIFFTLALLMTYRATFVNFARTALPTYMTSFAGAWAEVWSGEVDATQELKEMYQDNQDVKTTELTSTSQGKDDSAWYAKAVKYLLDGLISALGWILASLGGMFITVLILMQGFWVLGINTVLLGLGPLLIACNAHEKTEGLFWNFLKAWLVYGLLYLPVLGLGAKMAGVVFVEMTKMVAGSSAVFGDGSDIAMHFIFVLLGPLCAFAVVQAVPTFLSQMMSSPIAGAGAAAAPAAAAGMAASVGGAMQSEGRSVQSLEAQQQTASQMGAVREGVGAIQEQQTALGESLGRAHSGESVVAPSAPATQAQATALGVGGGSSISPDTPGMAGGAALAAADSLGGRPDSIKPV